MSEDPAARKARLRALKHEAAAEAAPAAVAEPQLKFRNYAVQDTKHVVHQQVAPAQPPKLEEPVIERQPDQAAQQELLVSVAPKKANWDLKRDVQPKLDKLERRTQRAIIAIMQEQEQQQVQQEVG
mmetsp:Transcript_142/g.227  ORF Transcript_142/g.227 Transcript_142/m.227 type:complete len:126 (+) Transcript_142:76-453(+)|eukprot:CAMPEP_0119101000 /NCGR_PEP_ID=MMETSP1180-20130426/119_1 /TAXON_ID=3052 ORGANISM="Chlamydomonas cf sp, Strain CCMP681" /NCGR_SAMPLE_ID=MMETSP1180 /ASSEMBLY_ACC=CAM_ASM_000741 /LENGTH=125 /DNA_ID=CAMNT_0007085009 /DNA_START=75 /DNA_END=452 /DNA_ORIENTATION=+